MAHVFKQVQAFLASQLTDSLESTPSRADDEC